VTEYQHTSKAGEKAQIMSEKKIKMDLRSMLSAVLGRLRNTLPTTIARMALANTADTAGT
jgi:hypothetical protein